jgi:dihydroorotate dehydrogenase
MWANSKAFRAAAPRSVGPVSRSLLSHQLRTRSVLKIAPGIRWSQQGQSVRHASTSVTVAGSSIGRRILNLVYGSTLILGFGLIYVYITDTRASAHRWVVIPALRLIVRDPEEAHEYGNKMLKALWQFGLHPRERGDPDKQGDLAIEVFGHTLRNPIGTSAGIDKHADIPDPLLAIGPAIIEIGGTTPMPQNGNDKPRVFRLPSQNALINRYGLNSEGADHVAMRLRQRVREFAYSLGLGYDAEAERKVLDGEAGVPPGSLTSGKLLAVNIATNKFTSKTDVKKVTEDYVYCVEQLGPYADILVVNVSSPNTEGLRSLQQTDSLKQILEGVVAAAKKTARKTKPSVMVKVSPDEDSDEQVAGICEAVWSSGVDGVIVGNTTNRRPESLPHLKNLSTTEQQHLLEQGGFSGPHLFDRTVALVKKYKALLDTKPNEVEPLAGTRQALQREAERLQAAIESTEETAPKDVVDKVRESVETQVIPPNNPSEKAESDKQTLFNFPTERYYDAPSSERDRLKSVLEALEQMPQKEAAKPMIDEPKVIFATGGITNGRQALEVLNAGASVAMVYTALVYGGIGTISRIKDEMREEMQKSGKQKSTR